jgi:hypothetical protein
MIEPGSLVLVHLSSPAEQFWGILEDLTPAGVTFRGLNVGSFDDFLAQAASGEDLSLGFSTLFVPMFRVERIYLDEQVGMVLSYQQRFEARVGRPIETFVERSGRAGPGGDDGPPS